MSQLLLIKDSIVPIIPPALMYISRKDENSEILTAVTLTVNIFKVNQVVEKKGN